MIKKKYILILGAGLMQAPAITAARTLGFKTIVCDGNPAAVSRDLADIFWNIDLKDSNAIVQTVLNSEYKEELSGVFTAGTDFSYSVACIAKQLNLPGIEPEVAFTASHKFSMRKAFKRHGVPSPKSMMVSVKMPEDQLALLLQEQSLTFPLVVKPVDSMGARGVITVYTISELCAGISDAMSFSISKSVIVESFIDAPEYSVDALFLNGELLTAVIARRHICFSPYSVEIGHTIPSDLSADQEKQLLSVFTLGVRAIGITTGAAKGDVFFSDTGPIIGEIAARLSGGYMSGWTLPGATGIPITQIAIQIATGIVPSEYQIDAKLGASAERAVISFPGIVTSINLPNFATEFPSVKHWLPRIIVGDRVVFPTNNIEKAGNVISISSNKKNAIEDAEKAIASIFIELSPADQYSRDIIGEPNNQRIPIAYPQNLFGKENYEEISWDSRSLEFSLSKLQQRSVKAIGFLATMVLLRYGLQAAIIVTDIINTGAEQKLVEGWEQNYREIYT